MITDDFTPDLKRERSELGELNAADLNDEFVGMKEAASFLKISISTMQKISANRLITVYKPTGGKVYFKKSDLLNYLNAGKLRPRKEVEETALKHQKVGG